MNNYKDAKNKYIKNLGRHLHKEEDQTLRLDNSTGLYINKGKTIAAKNAEDAEVFNKNLNSKHIYDPRGQVKKEYPIDKMSTWEAMKQIAKEGARKGDKQCMKDLMEYNAMEERAKPIKERKSYKLKMEAFQTIINRAKKI